MNKKYFVSSLFKGKTGVMNFNVESIWSAGDKAGEPIFNGAEGVVAQLFLTGIGRKKQLWRAEQYGDQPEFWLEVNDEYEYRARILRVGEDQPSSWSAVGPISSNNSSYTMTVTPLSFWETEEKPAFAL